MAHFNFLLYLKDPRQSGTFLWLAFGFRGISISCPRGPSLLLSNYFKHFLKSLIHPRKTKYFLHPIMSLTFRYPWVVPLLSSVSLSYGNTYFHCDNTDQLPNFYSLYNQNRNAASNIKIFKFNAASNIKIFKFSNIQLYHCQINLDIRLCQVCLYEYIQTFVHECVTLS